MTESGATPEMVDGAPRRRLDVSPELAIGLGIVTGALAFGLLAWIDLGGPVARVEFAVGVGALVVVLLNAMSAPTTAGLVGRLCVVTLGAAGLAVFFCIFLGLYREYPVEASTRTAPVGSYAFWSACEGFGPDGIALVEADEVVSTVYFFPSEQGLPPDGHRIRVLRRWFEAPTYWFVTNSGRVIPLRAGKPYAASCP